MWIFWSTLLCGAAWILSSVHQLNLIGYLVVFAIGGICTGWWLRVEKQGSKLRRQPQRHYWQTLRCRFRRALPMGFLVLAVIAFVGGILYAPTNPDAHWYRLPRVLHWVAAEKWHLIHTTDHRMNSLAPGFELLTLPLVIFTKSDRSLFVINALSYLLLPGLVFSVFRRMGVRPRVAWWWMWLVPCGYCYAMQAGGLANDSFSAIYALAAVDLALRAAERRRPSDLVLSMLAIALATDTKQTNIPLLLPWMIAAWPARRLFLVRPAATLVTAAVAGLVSVAPITWINLQTVGTWTGWPRGQDLQPDSPWWGLAGNTFVLSAQNLQPPIFPWAAQWNGAMERFLQTPTGAHFDNFEAFGRLGRAVSEKNAGLGTAVCVMILISFIAALCCGGKASRQRGSAPASSWWLWALRLSAYPGLLIFMAKVGSFEGSRYLASYYPLLIPLWLLPRGHQVIVRRRWWHWLAKLAMWSTILVLIFSRQRPLWPANTILGILDRQFPGSTALAKVRNSYGFNADFADTLKPLREALPANEKVVGYAVGGKQEVSLWRPFGSRRVKRVRDDDTAENVRTMGLRYIVVDFTAGQEKRDIQEWLTKFRAELVATMETRPEPEKPPAEIYLVRLLP